MTISQAAREAILECQVNAAGDGHDIGPFLPVDGDAAEGWQATCRNCGKTVWVGTEGLIYSVLGPNRA